MEESGHGQYNLGEQLVSFPEILFDHNKKNTIEKMSLKKKPRWSLN